MGPGTLYLFASSYMRSTPQPNKREREREREVGKH